MDQDRSAIIGGVAPPYDGSGQITVVIGGLVGGDDQLLLWLSSRQTSVRERGELLPD
jgi:hypothetical protein